MPRKITNPLREGLPSKMYLIAFPKRTSGYAIAQKIQGIEKREPHDKRRMPTPQTAKIYDNSKKWKEHFSRNKKGILSKADPLLDEIVEVLNENDFELTDFERYVLKKLVDSEEFRSLVGESLEEISFEWDIDSASEIMRILGNLYMNAYFDTDRVDKVTNREQFDEFWAKYDEILKNKKLQEEIFVPIKMEISSAFQDEKIKKYFSILSETLSQETSKNKQITEEELINGFEKGLRYIKLGLIPSSLIKKIVHLSPEKEMYEAGFEVAKMTADMMEKIHRLEQNENKTIDKKGEKSREVGKEFNTLLSFIKGDKRFVKSFRYLLSIQNKLRIVDLFGKQVINQISNVEKEDAEQKIRGYSNAEESLKLVAYYEAYLNAIYSFLENISRLTLGFFSKENLPPSFRKQRDRMIKEPNICQKYSKLLSSMDWYEEIHSIRSESTHYLTGLNTKIGDRQGYWNEPQSLRDHGLEKIDIVDIEKHIIGIQKNIIKFMDEYGKIFIKKIDGKAPIPHLCKYKDGFIGFREMSLNDFLKGLPGKCYSLDFDCPEAFKCPARKKALEDN